jgi:hypothetical protein
MGVPIVTNAGALRFLSYGQEFDNRVLVVNGKGAVWDDGLYENCYVQSVLITDGPDSLRVADVRISGALPPTVRLPSPRAKPGLRAALMRQASTDKPQTAIHHP